MNSNGIINSPVRAYADVATVLNTNSSSWSKLCTNDNINKWSRRKPVRFPSPNKISDDDAAYVSFGLDIKKGTSNTDYDTIQEVWEYLKPRGTSTEPYRLSDFDNYDHNAIPFITGTGMRDELYKNVPFYADLYISNELTEGSLTIDDFIYLKTCYFAAIIKNNSRSRQVFITAEQPLSGDPDFSRYLEYDLTNDSMFQVGDKVEVILFLSSNKAEEGDTEPSLNIYGIRVTDEIVVYKEFTIQAPKQQYYFTLQVLNQSVVGYNVSFGNFLITMHAPKDSYTGGILDGGYIKINSDDISYDWEVLQIDYKFDTYNTGIEEDSYTKEYTYNIQVSDLNEKWIDVYFYDKSDNILATSYVRINPAD